MLEVICVMLSYRKSGCIRVHQSRIVISTSTTVPLGQISSFNLVKIHKSKSGNVGTTVLVIFQIDCVKILSQKIKGRT